MIKQSISSKQHLWLLALLAMIGSIGVSLPYPIFAPMLLHPSQSSLFPTLGIIKNPAILFGALLAMYPLGLFIGSPVLGGLSDHYGRQKLIVGSLLCATVGYVISALALHYHNFFVLLLSRFFTGFMEGNIGILRAAVADRTGLNKHQAFGMIGTGVTLGYTIGPLLGASLSNSNIVSWFDFTIPFYAGACTTLIAALIAQIHIQEPAKLQPQKNQTGDQKTSKSLLQHFNIIRQLHILCRNRSLKWLFISSFCFWFAVDTYYEFYPAYLVKVWSMNAFDIALLTVVMSLGIAFGNLLSRFWARHYADITIIFWHIILFILILATTLLTSHLLSLYIVFCLTGIFIALSSNHLNVQISEIVNVNQQGEALGMATGLRMLGDASISFMGGFLIIFSTRIPLLCAIVSALGAALIILTKLYCPTNAKMRNGVK